MANISKVEAFGLWSHYESTFKLSPGLTVITGPNDSGKSSLIRIIRWVFLGKPQGDAFIFKIKDEETGEVLKEAVEGKVIITLDNGIVITKTRRGSKTIYEHSAFNEPFETADVPGEVKQALGIKYYSFGDFEVALNFAFQLEAPFLISEAASAGAKILGTLAGTQAVDLAIKSIGKDTYQARDNRRKATQDIENYNTKLLEYDNLDQLKAQLILCEDLIVKIDSTADRADRLSKMYLDLDNAEYKIEELERELDRLAAIPDLEEDLKNIEAANIRYELILDLYRRLDHSRIDISRLTAELTVYEGVPEAIKIIGNLEVIHSKQELLTDLSTKYDNAIRTIQEADKILLKTKDIGQASKILENVENNKNRLDRLKKVRADYVANEEYLDSIEEELSTFCTLDYAEYTLIEIVKNQSRYRTLLNIEYSYDTYCKLIDLSTESLSKFTKLEEAQEIINTLSNYWRKLARLRDLRVKYRLQETTVEAIDIEAASAEENVDAWEEELTIAWEEAGGICPLCEQTVEDPKNHVHQ